MDTAAAARAFREHGLSTSDTQALGESLGVALRAQLAPHLGEIHWFKADWQRGGAATGFATWTRGDGRTVEAMVKLPVGYREFFWTSSLGAVEEDAWDSTGACAMPTPRVLAAGEALNGYDLAWIVVEKLAGPPMSRKRSRESLEAIVRTTAEFQARCAPVRDLVPPDEQTDWRQAVDRSRDAIRRGDCPSEQRWADALKRVGKNLDSLVLKWKARPVTAWCHGDLHPANALRRASADGPPGRCVLVDMALVHPGHWIEDALYLERQHWGHEEFLFGVEPVPALAEARRELGLEVHDGFERWADIRRILTAASAPGLIGAEGNARYLEGALSVLTRLLRDGRALSTAA